MTALLTIAMVFDAALCLALALVLLTAGRMTLSWPVRIFLVVGYLSYGYFIIADIPNAKNWFQTFATIFRWTVFPLFALHHLHSIRMLEHVRTDVPVLIKPPSFIRKLFNSD